MGKGSTVLLLTCILFVTLIGAKKHHHHHRRHKAHLHTSLLKSSSIQTPQAAAEPAGAAKSSAKAEAPQDAGKQAPQEAGKLSAKQAPQDAPSAEGKVADQANQASAESAKDDNASDVLNKIKQLKGELAKNKAAAQQQQQQQPPKQADAEAEAEAEGDEEGAPEATPVDNSRIDIDTAMPYGELEPFGREDTAEELTEQSIRESDEMVDQLERAEVAEEKRSVFRALTRLRGAAITSFDGIARSQTGNIDQYNRVHKWRRTHPMHHLADEEGDVKKWAFPGRED